MVMRPALAILVCALATPHAADAKCAMWGLAPDVLTPSNTAITADGGIVVGALDHEDGSVDPGDTASQAGWRLRIGSRVANPTLVPIAPGLVLYKLPADAKEALLIDDKRATVGKVTVGAKTPALAAPKIKKIKYGANSGRRPSARITVEFVGTAPDGAIALVLADAKGKPRSWGRVSGGATTALAFDRGRCRVLANGTIESKPGERVTAFWVDSSGRKSPASGAMAITGTGPSDDE